MKKQTLIALMALGISQAVSVHSTSHLKKHDDEPAILVEAEAQSWSDGWHKHKHKHKYPPIPPHHHKGHCNVNVNMFDKPKKEECKCYSFTELPCPGKFLWRKQVFGYLRWGPDDFDYGPYVPHPDGGGGELA